MAKERDYSKIKALAASILECIGDENDTGENPDLPEHKPDKGSFDDVGTTDGLGDNPTGNSDSDPLLNFVGNELADGHDEVEEAGDEDNVPESKKKKKEASLAMMGSMLSSRVSKGNQA